MLAKIKYFLLMSVVIVIAFLAMASCSNCFSTSNTEFGNVPQTAGYGCWEKVIDCVGDIDFLTIDSIDWSRSIDGTIVLQTTPYRKCLIMSSEVKNPNGETLGLADKRGHNGFAEKMIDNSWEFIGEIGIGPAECIGQMQSSDGKAKNLGCTIYADGGTLFREMRVYLPEYQAGATYRLTYFFLEVDEDGRPNDTVHTLTHTITLANKTDNRMDFVSLGWETTIESSVFPEFRINYGDAPYLLVKECNIERWEHDHWGKMFSDCGDRLAELNAYESLVELQPCQRISGHYRIPPTFDLAHFINEPYASKYRFTLVFCDNIDESGNHYILELTLNTALLKEYVMDTTP